MHLLTVSLSVHAGLRLGLGACNADTCIGLSSGTAAVMRLGGNVGNGNCSINMQISLPLNVFIISLPLFPPLSTYLFIYADADGLGQASASLASGRLELLTRRMKLQQQQRAAAQLEGMHGQQEEEEGCSCRCLPYLRAYREDLGICVDDIHGECDCIAEACCNN